MRGGRGTVPSRHGDPRLRAESARGRPSPVTSTSRSRSEPVRKGTQNKTRGKKQKQEELFPELLKEIKKKRVERESGVHYTAEDRFSQEFRSELAKLSMERIGSVIKH